MQEKESQQGIKTHWSSSNDISVRHIFEDNHNWDVFQYHEKDKLRSIEQNEVKKMMSCKDTNRGGILSIVAQIVKKSVPFILVVIVDCAVIVEKITQINGQRH